MIVEINKIVIRKSEKNSSKSQLFEKISTVDKTLAKEGRNNKRLH